ncbi:MAG TPA: hypothetical protein VKJ00_03610 [Thermoanaerobaculia bacterium]|nr:hypothetical protein [Thermoanaerobaculia bacterium]
MAEEALPKGTIVERVVCKAVPQQTYALYLPAGYDPARLWPILYIFDPGARGARAAARFRSGAEQYGFVLAASNNSKNGPVDASLAAMEAMFADTHRRFALDDRRLYTAGFSGGARAATLVAELLKIPVAGVVACSGGFPGERPPTRNTAFAYFATAGETDFNYAEMTSLDATLEKLGVRHRLSIFPGPHSWAPENVCAEALAWMRLQEAARKIVDDPDLVAKSFDRRLAAVGESRAGGRLVEAERDLRSMERDFRSLHDTREVETELARIDEDPAYRKAAADQARRDAEERDAVSRLVRRLQTILQPDLPAIPRLLSDLEIEKWSGSPPPRIGVCRFPRSACWRHSPSTPLSRLRRSSSPGMTSAGRSWRSRSRQRSSPAIPASGTTGPVPRRAPDRKKARWKISGPRSPGGFTIARRWRQMPTSNPFTATPSSGRSPRALPRSRTARTSGPPQGRSPPARERRSAEALPARPRRRDSR